MSIEKETLLTVLKDRFHRNMHRHEGISWEDVEKSIISSTEKLNSLTLMEETGGEPDVIALDGKLCFIDLSKQSPKGRTSLCYDQKALDARKNNKPAGSIMGMAEMMGVEVITEKIYRKLQEIEEFDTKTSSWVKTPEKIRTLGGALFCDRRFDTVFTYHNSADSYYSARGFRCLLKL